MNLESVIILAENDDFYQFSTYIYEFAWYYKKLFPIYQHKYMDTFIIHKSLSYKTYNFKL